MAELSNQERLQPSLLDRLTDNAPEQLVENRDQRVLSTRQLRQSVLRDLSWLFNTTAMDSLVDLSNLPFVAESVLNYGAPALSGSKLSGIDVPKLQRKIKQVIMAFEPRILASTLDVKLTTNNDQMNQKSVSFLIEGDLWAQPLPIRLYIRTDLDLESGGIQVREMNG